MAAVAKTRKNDAVGVVIGGMGVNRLALGRKRQGFYQ